MRVLILDWTDGESEDCITIWDEEWGDDNYLNNLFNADENFPKGLDIDDPFAA